MITAAKSCCGDAGSPLVFPGAGGCMQDRWGEGRQAKGWLMVYGGEGGGGGEGSDCRQIHSLHIWSSLSLLVAGPSPRHTHTEWIHHILCSKAA